MDDNDMRFEAVTDKRANGGKLHIKLRPGYRMLNQHEFTVTDRQAMRVMTNQIRACTCARCRAAGATANTAMDAQEWNDSIELLGMSKEEAGAWLGYNARQGQRFAYGEVRIPTPVAKLLRHMIKHGFRPEDV
jgi:hypothetical protein